MLRPPARRSRLEWALRQRAVCCRGEEHGVNRRLAPRAVVTSGSPPGVRALVEPSRRFAAPRRGAAFWGGLWAVAVVAELGALVPIVFAGDAPVAGADVVYRLVGGSFAAFGLV